MRKLRWEVQNFRYANSCCDSFVAVPTRFRGRRVADEFMDRERDHGRLFLGASLWLILPGGRGVCRRYYDGGEELRLYLSSFRAGEVYPWQRNYQRRDRGESLPSAAPSID